MTHPKYKRVGPIHVRVTEEAAELIQAIMKAERFGIDNCYPDTDPSNRAKIMGEIEDLRAVLNEYEKALHK